MATFFDKHPDQLLTCPFDSNHKVKPSRYQQHISKCEKTSEIKLQTCPFIASHKIPKEDYAEHVANCPGKKDIPQLCFESIPTFKDSPTNAYNQEDNWESSRPRFVATGLEKAKVNKKLIESKHLNPITIQRLSKSERKHLYAKRIERVEAESKLKAQSSDTSTVEPINQSSTSPQEPFPSSKILDSPKWHDSDFPSLCDSRTPDLSESRYFKLIPSGFHKLGEFESQPPLVWPNSQASDQISSIRQLYTKDSPCGPSFKKESSCEASVKMESPCGPSFGLESSFEQSLSAQPARGPSFRVESSYGQSLRGESPGGKSYARSLRSRPQYFRHPYPRAP